MNRWWEQLPIPDETKVLMLVVARVLLFCGGLLLLLSFLLLPYRLHRDSVIHQTYYHQLLPKAASFKGFDLHRPLHQQTVVSALNAKKLFMGYIIESSGMGYSGPIRLLVGLSGNKVTGIRVLSHLETDGIGSQITDPYLLPQGAFTFLGQFSGKNIFDPFKPGEDLVTITGATRSCQGVGEGVRRAITRYRQLEHIVE